MKKQLSFLALALAILFVMPSCSLHSQPKGVKNISGSELLKVKKEQSAIVIDVRTPSEVSQGYIDGADQFLDYNGGVFSQEIKKLDKSKTYIIYCRSGGRSANASGEMAAMGFKKVYNVEGGISSYTGKIKKP